MSKVRKQGFTIIDIAFVKSNFMNKADFLLFFLL